MSLLQYFVDQLFVLIHYVKIPYHSKCADNWSESQAVLTSHLYHCITSTMLPARSGEKLSHKVTFFDELTQLFYFMRKIGNTKCIFNHWW